MNRHVILPIIISLLALLFLDPLHILMDNTVVMILLGGLLLAVGLYSFFILTDRVRDEREIMVRGFADRVACFLGMIIVAGGIAKYLVFGQMVPTVLIIILVVMVSGKALAQWYACKYF